MRSMLFVVGFSVILSACSGVQAPPIVNVNVGANSSSKTDLTLTQNNSESSKSEKSGVASASPQGKSKPPQETVVASFEKPFSDPDSGISIGVKEITGDFQASFMLFVPGKEPRLINRASPGWELSVVGLSGTMKIRLLSANIITGTVAFTLSR